MYLIEIFCTESKSLYLNASAITQFNCSEFDHSITAIGYPIFQTTDQVTSSTNNLVKTPFFVEDIYLSNWMWRL